MNPENGDIVVIEMNPRVSRSSALASKATLPDRQDRSPTGGHLTLVVIDNDITRNSCVLSRRSTTWWSSSCREFEKFHGASRNLGTAMKSSESRWALGGFAELLKAIASLEGGYEDARRWTDNEHERLAIPTPDRMPALFEALRRGWDPSEVHRLTGIDRWFMFEMNTIIHIEEQLSGRFLEDVSAAELRRAKRLGIPDRYLARILATSEAAVRERRSTEGIMPVFKRVDTCAAEFESHTPYLYSTFERSVSPGSGERAGHHPGQRSKPIGRGSSLTIAAAMSFVVQDAGFTSVMVNNNPETVSTDYDTSDKLYSTITIEHVSNVLSHEKPKGVILQFGGQTR